MTTKIRRGKSCYPGAAALLIGILLGPTPLSAGTGGRQAPPEKATLTPAERQRDLGVEPGIEAEDPVVRAALDSITAKPRQRADLVQGIFQYVQRQPARWLRRLQSRLTGLPGLRWLGAPNKSAGKATAE